MKDRPRWLARSPVVPLLAELGRGELDISHDALDRHPSRQAARRLEDLLVAAGALPSRDPAFARMEEWIEQHLAGSDHEAVLRPFAHWIVLRRYRRKSQTAPLNFGELGRAKAELVSGTAFLDWLTDRGRQLGECAQADIDAWLAGPRPDRHIARPFVRWAMAQKLMPRLEFPAGHRSGATPPITQHDPGTLARRLLEDPGIPVRERVAGILVAIYAQPIVRVARLTIDQITVSETETAIRFAETPVTLPEIAGVAVRAWLDQRQATMPPLATPSPAVSGQPAVTPDQRAIAQPPAQAHRRGLQPGSPRRASASRGRDPRSDPGRHRRRARHHCRRVGRHRGPTMGRLPQPAGRRRSAAIIDEIPTRDRDTILEIVDPVLDDLRLPDRMFGARRQTRDRDPDRRRRPLRPGTSVVAISGTRRPVRGISSS